MGDVLSPTLMPSSIFLFILVNLTVQGEPLLSPSNGLDRGVIRIHALPRPVSKLHGFIHSTFFFLFQNQETCSWRDRISIRVTNS